MAISKKDTEKTKSKVTDTINTLSEVKAKKYIRKTITIDELTLFKINNFKDRKGLDLSSAIRFICNEYLETK